MTYDAITLKKVTEELQHGIVPGRISQVHQIDVHAFVLDVSAESHNAHLLVSTHPRFYRTHLVSQEYPSRQDMTPFGRQLREILRHTVITSVHQLNWDRVLVISLGKKGSLLHSDLRLIIEMTGRMSNVIVTRSDSDVITACWKQVDAKMCRYRHILPGQTYAPPPPPAGLNPERASLGEFEAAMRRCEPESLLKCLTRSVQGFGQALAAEAIYLAGLQNDTFVPSLRADEIEALWKAVVPLFESIQRDRMTPTVYLGEDGLPVAVAPVELKQFGRAPVRRFGTMSRALEFYYGSTVEESEEANLRQHLVTWIRRRDAYWRRTEERIGEELEKARRSDEYKRTGDLILANMGVLKRGAARAEVIDYYDPDRPTVSIELDPKLSPEENADAYFRRAQKARKAVSIAERRLRETNENRQHVSELSKELDGARDRETLISLKMRMEDAGLLPGKRQTVKRSTTKGARFRRFVTTSGWTVLVGRNSRENEMLTFGLAAPDDIWFHARGAAGSHVVLRRQGRKGGPDKRTLLEAAAVAAFFSKGRTANVVPVSYTEKKYVRRPRGTRPGTVVMDREKTVMVEPKMLHHDSSPREK